jgi:hypothetical protein
MTDYAGIPWVKSITPTYYVRATLTVSVNLEEEEDVVFDAPTSFLVDATNEDEARAEAQARLDRIDFFSRLGIEWALEGYTIDKIDGD